VARSNFPKRARYFQELYLYFIDDFAIRYCEKLAKRDFSLNSENFSVQKKEKRDYLNDVQTKDFTAKLNDYFESDSRATSDQSGQTANDRDTNQRRSLTVREIPEKRKERLDFADENSLSRLQVSVSI
jgi:hypothetical protein